MLRRATLALAGLLVLGGTVRSIAAAESQASPASPALKEYRPSWVLCPMENRFPAADFALPDSADCPPSLFPRMAMLAVEWEEWSARAPETGNLGRKLGSRVERCAPQTFAAFRVEPGGRIVRRYDLSENRQQHPIAALSRADAIFSHTGTIRCRQPDWWYRIQPVGGRVDSIGHHAWLFPSPQGLSYVTLHDWGGEDALVDDSGESHPLGLCVEDVHFTSDSVVVIGCSADCDRGGRSPVIGPLCLSVFSRKGALGSTIRIGLTGSIQCRAFRPDGAVAAVVTAHEPGTADQRNLVVVFTDGTIVRRALEGGCLPLSFRDSLLCIDDGRDLRVLSARSLGERSRFAAPWEALGCGKLGTIGAVLLPGERVVLQGMNGRARDLGPDDVNLAIGMFDFAGKPMGWFVDLPGSSEPRRFQELSHPSLELFEPGWLLVSIDYLGLALYDVRE